MNWQSFDAVPQRPKPRKCLSAWAWRGSSRWLKMPCASACQISTSASVIGLPSPSITWPRIRMRWPEVWSVVRLVSSSTSSPNEKNGPTVWLGAARLAFGIAGDGVAVGLLARFDCCREVVPLPVDRGPAALDQFAGRILQFFAPALEVFLAFVRFAAEQFAGFLAGLGCE